MRRSSRSIMVYGIRSIAKSIFYHYDRRRFRGYVQSNEGPVVLSYSMGKVGSTSILRALKSMPFKNGVQHLHFLSDEGVERAEERHHGAGFAKLPPHLLASRNFIEMSGAIDKGRLRVIIGTRDPVAFTISNVFQNPYFFPSLPSHSELGNIDAVIDYLREVALAPDSESVAYWRSWFVDEVEGVFGPSIREEIFDSERGWSSFDADGIRLGVIQMEQLDSCFSELCQALFGDVPYVGIGHSNVRSARSSVYQEVMRRLRVNLDILDKIYADPWVRRLYSSSQIQRFRQRWGER